MSDIIHGAAVLLIRKDKTILMQHRDNRPEVTYADYWGYPAGTVEKGEEFIHAARRELTEETDYIPKEVFPLLEENYERYDGQVICRHIFWTMYDDIQKINCNEGQEMRFMSVEDISKEKLLPGQLEVIKKGLEMAFPGSNN